MVKLTMTHNHTTKHRYWRALVLEYVGTTIFVFCACASVVAGNGYGLATSANNLVAGIVQGFAIGAIVYTCSATSGGHINPAVTFGLMVSGDMPIFDGLGYILVQTVGGITGAALLSGVLPGQVEGMLGTTQLANGISQFQGFIFEAIVTFFLLFTIFGSSIDYDHGSVITKLAPIPIGFSVAAGVIIAFGFTGGSLNPARTFGPAVISKTWGANYIYWFGPMAGALLAGLLFRFVIKSKPAKEDEEQEQEQEQTGSNKDKNPENNENKEMDRRGGNDIEQGFPSN